MLMKGYIFVSRNFLLSHTLKKEDDLTSASYLHYRTLVKPSQMTLAILIDQLQ